MNWFSSKFLLVTVLSRATCATGVIQLVLDNERTNENRNEDRPAKECKVSKYLSKFKELCDKEVFTLPAAVGSEEIREAYVPYFERLAKLLESVIVILDEKTMKVPISIYETAYKLISKYNEMQVAATNVLQVFEKQLTDEARELHRTRIAGYSRTPDRYFEARIRLFISLDYIVAAMKVVEGLLRGAGKQNLNVIKREIKECMRVFRIEGAKIILLFPYNAEEWKMLTLFYRRMYGRESWSPEGFFRKTYYSLLTLTCFCVN